MTTQETIMVCQSIIHDKRYSRHPFVVELREKHPPKEVLLSWAEQKYHQVYLQNQIFSAIHSKTSHEDVRQFMIEQLIAEETPFTCGSDSHYNLMRRFADACGATEKSFDESLMSASVRMYVNKLLSICQEQNFVLGLLAIYAIEHQSSESVSNILQWLRDTYNFSNEQLEWFLVHAEEDDDHADAGLDLVVKYAPSVENFDTLAPKVVTEICDAWLTLHDYYLSLISGERSSDVNSSGAPLHAVSSR